MTYRLVIVTDGRGLLRGTLASFAANVEPRPVEVHVQFDGRDAHDEAVTAAAAENLGVGPWTIRGNGNPYERAGFCRTTADAWQYAADPGVDFVFWLEDDFRFLRGVDLGQLARVLDGHRLLAQIALCRGAANAKEEAAGGLVEARPGEFMPVLAADGYPWMKQRSYFTTNPSLMRREFIADHPFPANVDQCEGRFGLDLTRRGYSFGLMGAGEPWVEHVGRRQGTGY